MAGDSEQRCPAVWRQRPGQPRRCRRRCRGLAWPTAHAELVAAAIEHGCVQAGTEVTDSRFTSKGYVACKLGGKSLAKNSTAAGVAKQTRRNRSMASC